MILITADMLHSIAPYGSRSIQASLVPYLNIYLPLYGITSLLRVKHFIGQAAEESASFNTLTEYASGNEYEGRHDLGNVNPGDGARYKGRGIFQLTGRSNYAAMGSRLGIDLVNHPELAATPEIAVRTACEYWKSRNLQVYADRDDINAMTLHINGGYNGLSTRVAFTDKAGQVFKNALASVPVPTPTIVPVVPLAPKPVIPVQEAVEPISPEKIQVAEPAPTSPTNPNILDFIYNAFAYVKSKI